MLLDMGLIYSMIAANLQQSDNETEVPEIILFFSVMASKGRSVEEVPQGGGITRHHSHCNAALKCQR